MSDVQLKVGVEGLKEATKEVEELEKALDGASKATENFNKSQQTNNATTQQATAANKGSLSSLDEMRARHAAVRAELERGTTKTKEMTEAVSGGAGEKGGLTGAISGLVTSKQALLLAVTATTAAVSAGINVVAAAVKTTAAYGDQVNRLSQTTGLSAQTITGWSLAFESNNVSMEEGARTIQFFNRRLFEAQSGNKEAAQAFRTLGLDVKSFGNDTEGAIGAIAQRFVNMEDGAGKTAIAMELFGRGGARLIPVLNEGADGLARWRKEAELAGIVMSGSTAKAAAELNEGMAVLSATARGFWIEIGTPLVRNLAEMAVNMRQVRLEGGGLAAVLGQLGRDAGRLVLFGSEQGQLDQLRSQLSATRANIGREMANPFGSRTELDRLEAEERALIARMRPLQAFLDPTLGNAKGGGAPAPNLPNAQEEARVRREAERIAKEAARQYAMGRAAAAQAQSIFEEGMDFSSSDIAQGQKQWRKDEEAAWKQYVDGLKATGQEQSIFEEGMAFSSAQIKEGQREWQRQTEARQKASKEAAEEEIRDALAIAQVYRGDHARALEELRQKYLNLRDGEEAVKKIDKAQRDLQRQQDNLITSVLQMKSQYGILGLDILAVFNSIPKGLQTFYGDILKGNGDLVSSLKKLWSGFGDAVINELTRVAANATTKFGAELLGFKVGDTPGAGAKLGDAIGTTVLGKTLGAGWDKLVGLLGGGTSPAAPAAAAEGGMMKVGLGELLGGGGALAGAAGGVAAVEGATAGSISMGISDAAFAELVGGGSAASGSAAASLSSLAAPAAAFAAFQLFGSEAMTKLLVGGEEPAEWMPAVDPSTGRIGWWRNTITGQVFTADERAQQLGFKNARIQDAIDNARDMDDSTSAFTLQMMNLDRMPWHDAMVKEFAGYATGGDALVTTPTLVSVGESGPEFLSVRPTSVKGGGGSGNGRFVNNGVVIADYYTMRKFKRDLDRV